MPPDRGQLRRQLERRSDAQLLLLTPKSPDAFDVLFLRHRDSLTSFVMHNVGNWDVAADLVSETFATAFEAAPRFDPKRGEARGWLFGIAKMKLLASYRRQGVEREGRQKLGITIVGYTDEAWEEAESRIDAAMSGIVEGLDELPRGERDAVIARIVDERDYAEIAESEQAGEAAIRQRVSRGVSKLAKRLTRGESS
jgi:RNA polymerase sigma factor (sigma-70 family)